ncbi:MAG: hypothetical protein WBC22_12265 [Sedimentisphaerales bacterium]
MLKRACQCLMMAPEYWYSDEGDNRMKQLKIIVEKHPDGYVSYPLGVKVQDIDNPSLTVKRSRTSITRV